LVIDAHGRGIRARWVAADEVYGSDYNFRKAIEDLNLGYVVAVKSSQRVGFSRADVVMRSFPDSAWQRLNAGEWSKGQREYDWAYTRIPSPKKGWERGLLIRRSISDPEEDAFYLTSAREKTSFKEIVSVAGTRWAVESCFESAKNEVGLDQYEVRAWTGWYRHTTLAMFAQAYLTVVRRRMRGKKKHTPRPSGRTTAVYRSGNPTFDLAPGLAC